MWLHDRPTRRAAVTAAAAIPLAVALLFALPAAAQDEATEFFENRIRPLLVESCYDCHTSSALGGLRVDSRQALLEGGDRGPAIVPGDADGSLLLRAVRHLDADLEMPKSADKLTDEQIEDLARWVRMDAPWPDTAVVADAAVAEELYTISEQQRSWWAFQPLAGVVLPAVAGVSAIDRFVLARLEEAGLEPAGAATHCDHSRDR